jgi:uncharacterized SAM-dependent methyltransferase
MTASSRPVHTGAIPVDIAARAARRAAEAAKDAAERIEQQHVGEALELLLETENHVRRARRLLGEAGS